ncbi:hypothetical protein C8R43DRAFT_997180 [Mycena crocata]|nr:hypothetical protein C8R43DRAFT_997180 [Mycena crocata]
MARDRKAQAGGTCELCRRHTKRITRHHLYPREVTNRAAKKGVAPFTPKQKKAVAALCWPCHCKIHQTMSNDVLASSYHTMGQLRSHKDIRAWLPNRGRKKPKQA